MVGQYVWRAPRAWRVCNTRLAVAKQPLRRARMFRLGRGPPRVAK